MSRRVLSLSDRRALREARAAAKRRGRKVEVAAHERWVFGLRGEARGLARFERLESAVLGLSAQLEALGGAKRSGSKARLERLIQMLEDLAET